MDDMRNTSAPLYGKAEPATTKTTMSVREMRQLLGLGKTDSYWLLHTGDHNVLSGLFSRLCNHFLNRGAMFIMHPIQVIQAFSFYPR